MATVMEFTSPAEEFPLGTVFENLPDVTVELETGEQLLVEQSAVSQAVGDPVLVSLQPDRIHVFKTE